MKDFSINVSPTTIWIIEIIWLGILLYITKKVNDKTGKGWTVPTIIATFIPLFWPKAIEKSSCFTYIFQSGGCALEDKLPWIILIYLFVSAFATIIFQTLYSFIKNKSEEKLEDDMTKRKKEFIKKTDLIVNKRPKIQEKSKRKCPSCKTENALDAKRCFICGKELDYEQKNS